MTLGTPSVAEAGFKSPADRKKRLGQYFTGMRLARLLAALASAERASTILDPMAGTGDMLLACLAHGAEPRLAAAIEIDPVAAEVCGRRLGANAAPSASIVIGDAFHSATLARLPAMSWDVVITNPPYVRYQSTAHSVIGDIGVPNALEIRRELITSLNNIGELEPDDRALLQQLASGYSGLADLAVPAWLLCAALVRPGGVLAMVVPEAWLSRDYASPIQYLLSRWFTVDYVVEDADVAWFADALVKTTLVVARRVPRRSTAFKPAKNDGFLHIALPSSVIDDRSVIGSLYPRSDDPDLLFAARAASLRRRRKGATGQIDAAWIPANHSAERLRQATRRAKWLDAVEGVAGQSGNQPMTIAPPLPLSAIVDPSDVEFITLSDLGCEVGQGLRTGANKFFYATLKRETRHRSELTVSRLLASEPIVVPKRAALPVVRKQADLPAGFAIDTDHLQGRVLMFDEYALSEDVERAVMHVPTTARDHHSYQRMSDELASYIRHAARANIGTAEDPKYIPRLSAVVTNVTNGNSSGLPRFWYQLPRLADRHRPDLLMPRVNYGHVRALINTKRSAVVDANFSSLWFSHDEPGIDHQGLLALLNSSWCAAALELVGTVLGGGALKVEATHLRRLPLPRMDVPTLKRLSTLGRDLAQASDSQELPILEQIDRTIAKSMVGVARAPELVVRLRQVAGARLKARSR